MLKIFNNSEVRDTNKSKISKGVNQRLVDNFNTHKNVLIEGIKTQETETNIKKKWINKHFSYKLRKELKEELYDINFKMKRTKHNMKTSTTKELYKSVSPKKDWRSHNTEIANAKLKYVDKWLDKYQTSNFMSKLTNIIQNYKIKVKVNKARMPKTEYLAKSKIRWFQINRKQRNNSDFEFENNGLHFKSLSPKQDNFIDTSPIHEKYSLFSSDEKVLTPNLKRIQRNIKSPLLKRLVGQRHSNSYKMQKSQKRKTQIRNVYLNKTNGINIVQSIIKRRNNERIVSENSNDRNREFI